MWIAVMQEIHDSDESFYSNVKTLLLHFCFPNCFFVHCKGTSV